MHRKRKQENNILSMFPEAAVSDLGQPCGGYNSALDPSLVELNALNREDAGLSRTLIL